MLLIWLWNELHCYFHKVTYFTASTMKLKRYELVLPTDVFIHKKYMNIFLTIIWSGQLLIFSVGETRWMRVSSDLRPRKGINYFNLQGSIMLFTVTKFKIINNNNNQNSFQGVVFVHVLNMKRETKVSPPVNYNRTTYSAIWDFIPIFDSSGLLGL